MEKERGEEKISHRGSSGGKKLQNTSTRYRTIWKRKELKSNNTELRDEKQMDNQRKIQKREGGEGR